MTPKIFMEMLSNLLYEKRFGPYFIEPVVAGLDQNDKPFVSSADLIGCISGADEPYAVAGIATANMHGMCETLYKPDMESDELFETLAQSLLSAVDRDALSGWGGVVHIISKEGIVSKQLR